MQPPVPMLVSTITAPLFISCTISSLTTIGERVSPRIAPISTLQRIKAFFNNLGCNADVYTEADRCCLISFSLVSDFANIFTLAPNPKDVLAAASVTSLAPNNTTSIGGTPVILPNNNLPLSETSSAAINTEAIPVISLIDSRMG